MLLAAGLSSRMGETNKLLLHHKGQPLMAHSAAFFRRHFSQVYIITGFEDHKLRAACDGLDVNFIHNPHFKDGLGSSFQAGLMGIAHKSSPIMVALADQIFLNEQDIEALQTAYRQAGGEKVIIPQYEGQRGHPVLFPPQALKTMRAASPVMTGRHFIETYPKACHFTAMSQPHCVLDIDTPDDARQHLRPNESCHATP